MKVMIADDTPAGRLFSRAALLPVADNGDHRQQRADAAGQIFDIREFHIGGLAIKALKDGYRPDLAIIDINFSEVNATDIARNNLDADEEISQMRGFDILDALTQYSPGTVNVFVTAYAGDDALIGEELQRRGLRLGQGYYVRTSRAIGINDLSHHLRGCMEVIANNWAEQIPREDAIWLSALETADQILEASTVVNNRPISLKSLLAYMAVFAPGAARVLFANPAETLHNLLPPAADPDLPGYFRQTFVRQAILDFRNSENFAAENLDINRETADYILHFIRASHNNDRAGALVSRYYHFYQNGNVGQTARRYGENPWSVQFINALKQRRALLGLSRLAELPIWGTGRNRPLKTLFHRYMYLHGRTAPTEVNVRQHLYVRGLAKMPGAELLQMQDHLILPEEAQFLQTHCGQIAAEVRSV